MPVTLCIGASGSGKTTFINDVHKANMHSIYIRQYHKIRPYIKISSIPNFDPTELPYWDVYVREKKDKSIIVGGTIGGKFMPGLSGGQRKLFFLELLYQRISTHENLLIVLDEPFSGVTDDFVPYFVERLNQMKMNHNILLVTNDHIDALKNLSDNIITVSATDRNCVKVNGIEKDREVALLATSTGDEFIHATNKQDIKFFWKVELSRYGGLVQCFILALFSFGLFVATYWDSQPGTETLVIVAVSIVSYFTSFSYIQLQVDWRISIREEAEALLHCAESVNKLQKLCLLLFLATFVSCIQYWCLDAVIGTISSAEYLVAMIFDNCWIILPDLFIGLYTNIPRDRCKIFGSFTFLFTIYFSTTFSPGSGIEGLKELRYLFPRFYFWCMLPGGDEFMEGCPKENALIYLLLSSMIPGYIFSLYAVGRELYNTFENMKQQQSLIQRHIKAT